MICVSQKKASSLNTLKASPLSNWGCAVPPECKTTEKMHPRRVPQHAVRRPLWGRCYYRHKIRRSCRPTVTER